MAQPLAVAFPAHPSPDYLVGRDAEGRWIARDVRGFAGGVFVGRDAARRFAAHETDHRADAVRVVPDAVRLTLIGPLPPLQDLSATPGRLR